MFSDISPLSFLLTLNNLIRNRTRRAQTHQTHNMPHAARNNKRKHESSHKGHDQLRKIVRLVVNIKLDKMFLFLLLFFFF